MVFVDVNRDYYAVLDLTQACDVEDVKKNYHKLAKLYHPDRNRGREEEVTEKFQDIQTAHEILTDSVLRLKYDQDRKKRLLSTPARTSTRGHQRYPSNTTAHRPAQSNARPPPPPAGARPAFTSTASTFNTSANNPPASSGATRFSRFPRQPPSQTSAQADAEARAKQYNAWRQFGASRAGGSQQRARADDETKAQRSAWEATNNSGRTAQPAASKPGFGRSNTTRAPPRSWKPPNISTQTPPASEDHPHSHVNSSYFAPQDEPPKSPRTGEFRRAQAPTARRPFPEHLRTQMPNEVPFSEGKLRASNPYLFTPGERTSLAGDPLRRTTSTRDSNGYQSTSTNDSMNAQPASQPGTPPPAPQSGRPRSASPSRQRSSSTAKAAAAAAKGRTPSVDHGTSYSGLGAGSRENARFYMAGSSSENNSEEGIEKGQPIRTSSSSSINQRARAEPAPTWAKGRSQSHANLETGTGSASVEMPGNKPFKYDHHISSPSITWSHYWPFGPKRRSDNELASPMPNWAIPSSIQPSPQRPSSDTLGHTRSSHQRDIFSTKSSVASFPFRSLRLDPSRLASATIWESDERSGASEGGDPETTPTHPLRKLFVAPQQSLGTAAANAYPNFSSTAQPAVEHLSPSEAEAHFRSGSSDNMQDTFSSDVWKDKFGGQTFAPPSTSGNGERAASHPRRTQNGSSRHLHQVHSQPPGSGVSHTHTASEPNSTTTGPIPPPPPYPPGQTQQQQPSQPAGGPVFPPAPGETKFRAEEWSKTFKEAQFEYPNQSIRQTSPTKTGRLAKTRAQAKTQVSRPAFNNSNTTQHNAADEGKEAANGRTSRSSGELSDGSAMDIDTEELQPAATMPTLRTARNVSAQVNREDWRHQSRVSSGQLHPHPMPPPTSNPVSPTSAHHARAGNTTNGINLSNLENVAPFKSSKAGVKDMSDLGASLPFPSRTSRYNPHQSAPRSRPQSHHGSVGFATQSTTPYSGKFSLPSNPQPPRSPEILTPASWRDYLRAVRAYIAEWNRYDSAVTAYFSSKQEWLDALLASGTPDWLYPSPSISPSDPISPSVSRTNTNGAGKPDSTSCQLYVDGLEADEDIRERWSTASAAHRQFMARHVLVRERATKEHV